jgi:Tfp pilus assembly protein PilF
MAAQGMVSPDSSPESWRARSTDHARAGRWQDALECVQRALLLASDDRDSLLLLGQCLVAIGRRDEAHDVATRLASMPLGRADWNDALGALLTYCDDPVNARRFFERAVALAPGATAYRYNLATAQRMTGDLAGTEASLNRVIAAAPGDAQAHYMRSDLRTQTRESNHIDEMALLMHGGVIQPRDEILLCFAVAKELADVARHEESFVYLKRGCDLQRRLMTYDVRDDVATMDRIVQLHDHATTTGAPGAATDECIFVIGLPRSGTTLVEQILGSHSAVQSAGELQAFPAETMKAVHRQVGRAVGKLDFVERSREVDARALGHAYLEATRLRRGRKLRFVDKQPLNYLYAGLIRRALPGVRIVALARQPMDSCYAMYRTLFTNAYPFTYNLDDLGQYYVAWHRLMRHWQSLLGDSLLIVQYEDLIANQEAVSRRIVAHCGLAWEDACLAFHQRQGAVATASAAQVRRELYATSVGKWRHVERQLAPLAEHLKQCEPQGGWRLAPQPPAPHEAGG